MKCKRILPQLIILICFIIFIISIFILIKDYIAYKKNKNSTEQLIQEVVEVDTITQEPYINWDELNAINPDIIAWIEIPNTNINYPILNNNLYYLNHTYDKKYSSSGSIFTTNNNPFEEKETILCGHNMKNGTMFSELNKYLKKDFFNTNNLIKVYTPNGDYEAIVFSAYSISIDDENNNIKSLDFTERINYYKSSSKYTVDNISSINKILKLSTCSYINAKMTPTEQRYYIIANLIPIL